MHSAACVTRCMHELVGVRERTRRSGGAYKMVGGGGWKMVGGWW